MLHYEPSDNVAQSESLRYQPPFPVQLETLVELACWRAEKHPERAAFTFLGDGEHSSGSISFQALNRRAQAIAANLQERGAKGERVLLLFEPGLDFATALFGCLYAGAIAVPVYPPDPLRLSATLPRLEAIVCEAGARYAMGTPKILQMAAAVLEKFAEIQAWDPAEIPSDMSANWTRLVMDPGQTSVLQFTSGSTGTPRGVSLTHHNIMHALAAMESRADNGMGESPRAVSWLPPYHDMGLIGCNLLPVFSGCHMTFMSPLSFIERPLRWLHAISRTRSRFSAGPNFAYELCVRRATPKDCEQLDLSCWEIAVVGAEPVRAEMMDRFVETFGPYGFRRRAFLPAYGLAEAVLNVSGITLLEEPVVERFDAAALREGMVKPCKKNAENAIELVGCGREQPDEEVVIVDPQSCRRVPPDQVGEIWFKGPHVAAGYWNCPLESSRLFRAWTADTEEGPFLRTGDLGFVRNNQLYICGRLKELIIIAGRNYYPQDIERAVTDCHAALHGNRCMAFSCDVAGREQLVVIQEVRRSQTRNASEILASIRKRVAEEYLMLPHAIVLVPGGVLPKTSSGKPRRRECRNLYLENQLEVLAAWKAEGGETLATSETVAPRTPLEREISSAVADVLGAEQVGVHDDLYSLGISSLMVAELLDRLRHVIPPEFHLAKLLEKPTVAGLAEIILSGHLERNESLQDLLTELEGMSDEQAGRLHAERSRPTTGSSDGES